jgi:uncharacterized membrane protein
MKWLGWILATLAVAVVVHVGSVMALPHLIMVRTMTNIGRGGVNTMLYGKRPTAASRGVVRPSPDLLYATCLYDLDKAGGAVRVHAENMPDTYWSISMFDNQTDNFYVINDRQAKGRPVDLVIVAADASSLPRHGTVVRAPSRRGLVLVRLLIDDDAHLAAIDAGRHHATCEALH